MLGRLLNDPGLAAETIALIKTDSDLLLPGAFVEGIAAYKSQLNAGSIARHSTALADTILECASADVLKTLKTVGCDFATLPDGTLGQHISIAAMAVLAKEPITEQDLLSANLPVEYFEQLRNQGWFQRRSNGFCLPAIVSSALRLQIETLLEGSGSEKLRNQLADAVNALIQAVEREGVQDDDARLDETLEEAIAWLERRLPGETLIGDRLWRAFLPYTTDDLIAPISVGDSVDLLKRFGDSSEPVNAATAIAKLVLEVRIGNDANRFLADLRAAIGLAKQASVITVHQLRGLDGAAFSGGGRYQLLRESLELREALVDRLYAWANSGSAAPNFKRTAASWLLTTADLGFRLGKPVEWSKQLCDQANQWLGTHQTSSRPGGAESELGWLRARASRLAALLETNPEARIEHLRAAVAEAEQALLHGVRKINQARFYLRMVRNLLVELSQEDQRRQAVEAAIEFLGAVFGKGRDDWPLDS